VSKLHLYLLAGLLVLAGASATAYKVLVLGFPLSPNQRSEIWRVELQLAFDADGGPAKMLLSVPSQTGQVSVMDQGFAARGYGVTTERTRLNERAVFSIADAQGRQYLYYRVVVDLSKPPPAEPQPAPTSQAPRFTTDELLVAHSLVDSARAKAADARTLAEVIVERLKAAKPGDEASYLLGRDPMRSQARVPVVAVNLLRLAGVPAEVVNGVLLKPERRNARFVHWLEIYDEDHWVPIYTGDALKSAGAYLLPWWRGPALVAHVQGGKHLTTDMTVSRSLEFSTRVAVARQRALEHRLIEFSLFGLPLQAQLLFRTLLAVPLGAFVLVVLRNVVGFKTFGTFMPVLIALAFRQTGLTAGIVFFTIVLSFGLVVRFYFEHLKLLLVPRLASILIVVVMVIAALSVVSHRLGVDVGLSLGLFPIVILTMTIERMTIAWEERGPREALQQAGGSLAVAAVCYLLIQHTLIRHLLFVFPELLLIVLAATLLLGRYTGYRLVELRRFRVLAK
jgi:hypothetical protein